MWAERMASGKESGGVRASKGEGKRRKERLPPKSAFLFVLTAGSGVITKWPQYF